MKRSRTIQILICAGVFRLAVAPHSAACAEPAASQSAGQYAAPALPTSLSRGWDFNLWGWVSFLGTSQYEHRTYGDMDLAVGVTRSFDSRVALTADLHLIDANGSTRGFLEQGFASFRLSDHIDSLLTIGKFNANFGVEPRNFWQRLDGTTSLLFGAQPQDLIGIMLTQPIGDSGLTMRPFFVEGFEGHFDFNRPPSAGISMEYHPRHEVTFALTNWVGPGFVRREEVEDEEYANPLVDSPDEYGHGYTSNVIENWQGPNFSADRGGTLYFVDARATWLPRPDLTLSAEALLGTTNSSDGNVGWDGFLFAANFDISDRFRVFGRWSFLDDSAGLVTGIAQHRHELSAGAAWQFPHGVELRTEYRHDFSNNAGDVDSISLHLAFTY